VTRFFYLAVFLAGLALAVQVMLHGVERWKRRRSARPSAAVNPPTVAAFAVGIGASGYLFTTRSSLSQPAILGIAIAIGIAAFAGMTLLMAKWALRPDPPHDEAGDINGQVATVSRAISPEQDGEITWHAWGQRHVLRARAVNDDEIPVGTEVVIDVVEEGVARVELWSVVEQRL
jgi:hypothetical protein